MRRRFRRADDTHAERIGRDDRVEARISEDRCVDFDERQVGARYILTVRRAPANDDGTSADGPGVESLARGRRARLAGLQERVRPP